MNDETKAALESLRREMADGDPDWWKRERLIFNHIDGEPARLAAAREECIAYVRQCGNLRRRSDDSPAEALWEVAAALERTDANGKHATLLADELRTLRAENDRLRTWVSTVSEALGAIEPVSDCRVEMSAEASAKVAESLRALVADMETIDEALRQENTTLRARVAELEAQLGGMTEQWKAELNHANAWMRKHRAAEAQVAAARKFIEDDTCRHDEEKRAVLRAMDEAAK